MTAAFLSAATLLAVTIIISLYCGAPNVFIAVCAAAFPVLLACYAAYEAARRRRLVSRVEALFDGGFSSVTDESELSGLERRVRLRIQSGEAKEARLRDGYANLSSLVSDIAHQCKTPLSSVLLCAEALPDGENTRAVRCQTEKLAFLMEALTKLSKCESGLIAENLNPSQHSVEELVCAAVTDVYAAADAKGVGIVSDIAPGVTARFDMRWTAEALFNLLDNAVKYSPAGGVVRISAEEYDMFARIDVADSGCGIPEDELCNIWKRFYRGSNAAEAQGGAGIGLYLCKAIVTGEGGRTAVKSDSSGSVFTLFLPKE